VRIAAETSLSPGWLLVAFPAVLYPAYLALEALFGRGLAAAVADIGSDFEAQVVALWGTSLGYITMMYVYVTRGTFRDLEALRPVLRGNEAKYADLSEQLTRFDRRRLWIGALIGVVFFCLVAELLLERWTRLMGGEWSVRIICNLAVSTTFWIVSGRGAVYLIDSARLYSRIGERHVAVDLLDLGPLSPLTRHGLRIVLLTVIITAAAVVVATASNPFAFGSPVTGAILGCLWAVPLVTAAFLLPVRGLRRQIRVC
jgi:hypothetical protein